MEKVTFFESQDVNSVLKEFNIKLRQVQSSDNFIIERNKHILKITNSMEKGPEQWDIGCQMNIGWIGNQFLSALRDRFAPDDEEYLFDIYVYCFRFINELYLSMDNDLEIEFSAARRFGIENKDNFPDTMMGQIEFALLDMPIAIFKKIANSDEIRYVKELDSLFNKVEEAQVEINKTLNEREKRVEDLKKNLDQFKFGYNFVGLYDGFYGLSKIKSDEKHKLLLLLVILACLTFVPILSELAYLKVSNMSFEQIKGYLIVAIVPSLSFIFLCIYYFRVVLYNYKNVTSQILQIDLRMTLCRFVQSYAEYSAQLKKESNITLEKFENIIFSAIVSDEENLPTVYDGIDHISKLVSSFKK